MTLYGKLYLMYSVYLARQGAERHSRDYHLSQDEVHSCHKEKVKLQLLHCYVCCLYSAVQKS